MLRYVYIFRLVLTENPMRTSLRLSFEVSLWAPRNGCWYRASVRRVRSEVRARCVAKRWLSRHVTVETRQRPERWTWFARIESRKTGKSEIVEAPVEFVPSVGELGYW